MTSYSPTMPGTLVRQELQDGPSLSDNALKYPGASSRLGVAGMDIGGLESPSPTPPNVVPDHVMRVAAPIIELYDMAPYREAPPMFAVCGWSGSEDLLSDHVAAMKRFGFTPRCDWEPGTLNADGTRRVGNHVLFIYYIEHMAYLILYPSVQAADWGTGGIPRRKD
jgi:hypothetical protein